MPEISAKTWNRFITTNLYVSAEVMGSIHEFNFENHNVTIRLPKREQADRDQKYDDVANIISYRSDTKEPLLYNVKKVDVEIQIPKKISVPEEALIKPPKQFKYFTDKQKKEVDAFCTKFSNVAERAFQYWLEIIRWISGYALIGQPIIKDFKSGWSTYILDSSTNNQVWCESVEIKIYRDSEITKEHWEKALEHLMNGDVIPMHLRFFHDAKASRRNGQYEKAIIELAMSCEIYLRQSVFGFIPDSTPEQLKNYIEEANINQYVSKFFKGLVPDYQTSNYKKIAKEISSLMSKRNSYLHMGILKDADNEQCCRFTEMAEQLFKISLEAKQNSTHTD